MNQPHQAFLQEIQSDPEDIVPRLVYADWLEENGDPLADLIRVQCELAELPVDAPERGELIQRERELLIEHQENIVQPLQKFSPHVLQVSRGFVESIRLDADILIEHADEILQLLPGLCSLTIRKSAKYLDDLVKLPQLQHVKSLSLSMAELRDDGLQRLLSSPHWSGLVELNLRGNDLTVVGLRWLSECSTLSGLRRLDLSLNEVSGPGLSLIRKSEHFQNLKHLAVGYCASFQVSRGLQGPGLARLESLDLNSTGLDASNMARLLDTDRSYRTLNLNRNGIGKGIAAQLGRASATGKLQHLEVSHSGVRVAGVKSLLAAKGLPEIEYLAAASQGTLRGDAKVGFSKGDLSSPRYLDLAGNGINDRALPGLLRSGLFARTVDLNLRRNKLNDESAVAILESEHAPALRRIHLAGNGFSNWLLSDLAKLPQLRQIERIMLDRSMMTDRESFRAFFKSPHRNPFVQLAVPTGRGLSRTETRKTMTDQIVKQLGEEVRPMLDVV